MTSNGMCDTSPPHPTTLAKAELYLQNNSNELNDPKTTRKYNLHYDDVRGDVSRPHFLFLDNYVIHFSGARYLEVSRFSSFHIAPLYI